MRIDEHRLRTQKELADYEPPKNEPSAREQIARNKLDEEAADVPTFLGALEEILPKGEKRPVQEIYEELQSLTLFEVETIKKYLKEHTRGAGRDGNVFYREWKAEE